MKKIVVFLMAFAFSASTYALEADGFIVKLRPGMWDAFFGSNTHGFTLDNTQGLRVSFGDYLVIDRRFEKSKIDALAKSSFVEYIEPNYIWSVRPIRSRQKEDYVPEDEMFSQQWGLKNTGNNSSSLNYLGQAGMDMNALEAWKASTGDPNLIIAVIDTGIEYTHPDLKSNMWVNQKEKNGKKGVDDDGNGYVDDIYGYDFYNNDGDPIDGHSHGTHCAGIIGASHNQKGVAGMMKDVQLMAVKFLSDQGRGSTQGAIRSVDYAMKMGAKIMSNSWGGGGRSQALYDAIKAAHDQGIFFVAAAGNSRSNNDTRSTYPANYKVDNVISVGAMDGSGHRASFSNYGAKTVHVFAPGVNVLSTIKNGGYQKFSGTSMATPFVSGAIGLYLSLNQKATTKEVREILIGTSSANPNLSNDSVSKGHVNAAKFIQKSRF